MNFVRTSALTLVLAACTTLPQAQPIPAGAGYVAMGSSFSAGPGVPSYYETPATPCARSTGNYAHLIASRHSLVLTDVSCSGGTTAHLTGSRDAIPPQLDALSPDTRLVTITIGGNDLNYIGRLSAAGCRAIAAQEQDKLKCPNPAVPDEAAYAALATRMDNIAKEVRRRAPQARLVFVDYLAILPATGVCAATPLLPAEADALRETAKRLAAITAKAALDNGADILKASDLSASHGVCASDPWMNGYPIPSGGGTPYHPNAKGMAAVADALDKLLWP